MQFLSFVFVSHSVESPRKTLASSWQKLITKFAARKLPNEHEQSEAPKTGIACNTATLQQKLQLQQQHIGNDTYPLVHGEKSMFV